MPDLSVLVTSGLFLGGTCVFTGFLTTVSQQWAAHTNTTGRSEYGRARYHTFDHAFFMQTFLFLGQLSCLGVYRIIRKLKGPEPEPEPDPVQVAIDNRRMRRTGPGGPGTPRRRVRDNVGEAGGEPGAEANGEAGGNGAQANAGSQDGDDEENEVIQRRRNRELRLAAQRGQLNRKKAKDKKEYNKAIFLLCSLCSFARTGLLFIGIRQTYPSSFIMLQGVGLLSTCLLTIAFVGREKTVKKLQWVGASICTVGLAVCGIVDYVWVRDDTYDPYGIAAGDLLIVMAHLMTAIQVLLEQRFVKKHDIDPLVAVGLEGMFGSGMLLVLLIPFYFVDVGAFNTLPKHRLEDPYDAFLQMGSSTYLTVAFIGSIVFFPFFYYCGVAITKHLDAVHRMGVEININILAWLIYLIVGWEQPHPIQALGIVLAFLGVFIFFLNPIIDRVRVWRGLAVPEPRVGDGEAAPLLDPANPGVQGYGAPRPEVNVPM